MGKVIEDYVVAGDCVFVRPVGVTTLPELAQMVHRCIVFTRDKGLSKLLINTTRLTGFPFPNEADRYFMIRDWAATSQGAVRLAFVAPPEMVDPRKFGVTVAQNAGFDLNVFTAEPAAIAWLERKAEERLASDSSHPIHLVAAHEAKYLPAIRSLFSEYVDSLNIDLCFQNFDQELAELPGRYAPPEGRLWLALENEEPAGCVALRKIADGICEMKRLYVRPVFRRRGLGQALALASITAAREIGYEAMRLDTLDTLLPALALYESLGFQRTAPYYDNPSPGVVFMELKLAKR
jgi:ribosomal protein S18 acetylase RimI-like enzyme